MKEIHWFSEENIDNTLIEDGCRNSLTSKALRQSVLSRTTIATHEIARKPCGY